VGRLPPEAARVRNQYVWSVVSAIAADDGGAPEKDDGSDVTTSLTAFLDREDEEESEHGRQRVLIFDQFEEILTLDPTDRTRKEEFFRDIGLALQNTNRWALFSMREDYMGGLARYAQSVPSRLMVRYRVDFLEHEAALRAIQKPAEQKGVVFTDEAANSLVDDLARVSVQRAGSTEPDSVPGPYVEPAQLQVVCYDLWRTLDERLGARFARIDKNDLEKFGRFDYSLGHYYQRAVAEVAKEEGASERAIREWFGEKLITQQGFRSQWAAGPETGRADVNAVLNGLRARYLVRSDQRGSTIWHELAHDRLITPIRDNNAYWRRKNLPPVEVAAEQWSKAQRDSAYLLVGPDLDSALKWLQNGGNDASRLVEEFVAESVKVRKQRGVLARYGKLVRLLVTLVVLLIIVIMVLVALLVWR
jgi:hypothetical protein